MSDLAGRRVEDAEHMLGILSESEKNSIRSYFIKQGQDKAKMTDAEYRAKYTKENLGWIPDVVRRYFDL